MRDRERDRDRDRDKRENERETERETDRQRQERERKKEYYQSLNRAKRASYTDLQSTPNGSRTGDSLH